MRRLIFIIAITIFFVSGIYSQRIDNSSYTYDNSWTTPQGTTFYVWDLNVTDWTPGEKSTIRNGEDTAYPDATRIKDPTAEYNCHFYSLETSFNASNKQWLNFPDVYLDDCSFLEVTNNNTNNRVLYYLTDSSFYVHSGVATATSGVIKSKWGKGSLMSHEIEDCIYAELGDYEIEKFRKTIVLQGSASVNCTSETYTSDIISGYTSSWSKSSNLSITSSYGSATVTPTNGGSGYVSQTVTKTGCSNRVFTKSLSVTDDVPDTPTSITEVFIDPCINSLLEFDVVDNNDQGTTYNWTVSGPGSIDSGQGTSTIFVDTDSYTGYLTVGVRAQNVCGNSSYIYNYNTTIDCDGGGQQEMSLSPIPTAQYLEVDISETSTEEPEAYTVIVLDLYNGIKKSTTMRSTKKNIYVGDLQDGIYIMVLRNNKKVLRKKFVIKK